MINIYGFLKKHTHFNTDLQKDYDKYGSSVFKYDILCYCDECDLRHLESKYIEYFGNVNSYNLYNKQCMYTDKYFSEDVLVKMCNDSRRVHNGSSNGMYGKHHTIQSKQLMSINRKGISAWNKGIPQPQSVKDKISKTLTGRKMPEYQRQKISKATKGKSKKGCRRVYTDEYCNMFRNFCLCGVKFTKLAKILNVNTEPLRNAIRRYEKEKGLFNCSKPYLLLK